MTTTPPEPPGGYDPNAGGYGQPPQYGGMPGGGMPAAPGQWAGPPLASWIERVGAALIDGVIAYIPILILGRSVPALAYLIYFGIVIYLMYLQGTTGQTWGKKLLKIKVLREQDGQVIGFGMAIARYFVHILDAIPCGIGYLFPLWDAKKQTFADKLLSTEVVKA